MVGYVEAGPRQRNQTLADTIPGELKGSYMDVVLFAIGLVKQTIAEQLPVLISIGTVNIR